ncbi:MAG: acyltransferase [Bacteroidota bacterium]
MRLREIDFLRGIAVILVLFRHYAFFAPLYRTGWIGVDLFFVLSGFLVSGLLFKEYQRFGNISGGQFLIRRGFKIYPLFYCALGITFFVEVFTGQSSTTTQWIGELVFIQNYLANIWNHTWSLAVEEHFYLLLTLVIFLLARFQILRKPKIILTSFALILLLVLGMRFYAAHNSEITYMGNFFPTHLRIDSLLFGVVLSWVYHFRNKLFLAFFSRRKFLLFAVSAVLILPSVFLPVLDYWMITIGFTGLYLGFGLLLGLFIADKDINSKLNRLFTPIGVTLVAKVGYYSYSIYLFHMFVIRYIIEPLEISFPYRLEFFLYCFLSILIGILMTKLVELPFLKLRDKIVPRRAKVFTTLENDEKEVKVNP